MDNYFKKEIDNAKKRLEKKAPFYILNEKDSSYKKTKIFEIFWSEKIKGKTVIKYGKIDTDFCIRYGIKCVAKYSGNGKFWGQSSDTLNDLNMKYMRELFDLGTINLPTLDLTKITMRP